MKTQIKGFPLRNLVVMTAKGEVNPITSKAALRSLAANPDFDWSSEVLLDLRDIECTMSMAEIYLLAEHMAFPNPALPTHQKIALLVDSHSSGLLAFGQAQFLGLCAENRGLKVRAFDDYDRADEWLNADLPIDPRNASISLGQVATL